MKRWLVVIVIAVVLAAIVAAFFAFNRGSAQTQTVLPNPNGYDDFAAAGQWLVGGANVLTMPPEAMRDVVKQNAKALETVREGLKKQSAVPVANDQNWINTHLVRITTQKSIAQLLVAEGMVHLQEGRTNEAARCFADCLLFAHAAHHQGLMIDELVGIACQAIGSGKLVQVAPGIAAEERREILRELVALDQAREPAPAILQRDRDWSRGAYGWVRSIWARTVMNRTLRAAEGKFEKGHARSIAALRLVMTELAVRGYEAKNGKPPTALAELVPAWLPAVPIDPFSNRPLLYRATTNSFLLYSVGPDGKDDGGTPLQRGGTEKGDLLPTAL